MFSVAEQVGLRAPAVSSSGSSAPVARVAIADTDSMTWYSPQNPLVWLGGVLVVTFGLASVAGSVRLGKAKVSGSIGKA